MLIIHHIIITSSITFLFFLNGWWGIDEAFIFFVGGLFVDVDHMWSYWYYQKRFCIQYNTIKNWCLRIGSHMEHFFILHTVWFALALYFLIPVHSYTVFLLRGVLLHYVLDIIHDAYWYFVLKKNIRPYRRWVAPISFLKKCGLERYL